jgi:quinoprotein glucose dehydrogenase
MVGATCTAPREIFMRGVVGKPAVSIMVPFRIHVRFASFVLLGGFCGALSGQDSIRQVGAPGWVQMFDQSEVEPLLAGLHSPRGIKIEIVAEGLNRPLGLSFGSDGTAYVLSAKADDGPAELVALIDADSHGQWERAEARMKDLPGRASLLAHDDWLYFAGPGAVIRRRKHDEELFRSFQGAAEANEGPPTTLTPDGQWIEQQIVRGLNPKTADQIGGLSLGFGGWIYLSAGGADNRPQSWDGSQAAVLGSGAIFRFRPDGSKIQEYSRGFAQPAGPLAGDGLGNYFQVETNSKGWRLIHALEGGDFGWRSDLGLTRLDRPGTLLALVHSQRGACDGVLAYRGVAFPKFFQGLLLLLDSGQHQIRAVMPSAGTDGPQVGQPFILLSSDTADFVPTLAVQGPDDAIYVCDSRPKAKGRLLRLTWSGTAGTPAIAPRPLKAAPRADGDALATALDTMKPALERGHALDKAVTHWNKAAYDACLKIIAQDDATLARLAAEALGDHLPEEAETQELLAGTLQDRLLRAALPVRRSLYLTLGKLGTKYDAAPEWTFEATSVTPEHQANRYLFDGHVRALEMPKDWAAELLLGNLEVALFDPNPEPDERQRLKKFVVSTAEAMRTPELAQFLNRLIRDEKDYFSKLEAPLQARLLPAYRNVLADPPVRADAVALWLAKHPSAALDVQVAACETLASVGTAKPEPLVVLVESRLASGQLDAALQPSLAAALEHHRDKAKPGPIDELIERIKK